MYLCWVGLLFKVLKRGFSSRKYHEYGWYISIGFGIAYEGSPAGFMYSIQCLSLAIGRSAAGRRGWDIRAYSCT